MEEIREQVGQHFVVTFFGNQQNLISHQKSDDHLSQYHLQSEEKHYFKKNQSESAVIIRTLNSVIYFESSMLPLKNKFS